MACTSKTMKTQSIQSFILAATLLACPAFFAPANATPPAAFTTIQSVADLVPMDVEVETGGSWNANGIRQASKAIISNAKNHPATFKVKVESLQMFNLAGSAFRIKVSDDTVNINGSQVPCHVWAYFWQDQAFAYPKIQVGSTVTLSGMLGRADIHPYKGDPQLNLDLYHAKVEGLTQPTASTASPANSNPNPNSIPNPNSNPNPFGIAAPDQPK